MFHMCIYNPINNNIKQISSKSINDLIYFILDKIIKQC